MSSLSFIRMNAKITAIVAVVILLGVGAGTYYVMDKNKNEKTEMEESDYEGSIMATYSLALDRTKAYAEGADENSSEFRAMTDNNQYKNEVRGIIDTKQAEIDNLTRDINNQILAEYKEIERVNRMTGIEDTWGEFKDPDRLFKGNGEPLESSIAYMVRAKNYYESLNAQHHYDLANISYLDRLPQGYKDLLAKYGIEADYERDGYINRYCGSVDIDRYGNYHFDNPVN